MSTPVKRGIEVKAIRPLEREDLGAVAGLYAELTGRDPRLPAPGFEEFFDRTLLRAPLADPELPSLVYDDSRDGVVGVIGSHPRRYAHGEREVLLACSGPLIVRADHRPRGLGALLLRGYLAGPQDMTFNDRLIDDVHAIWRRLGGVTDAATSIGWRRVIAPVGAGAAALARRGRTRHRPPAGSVFAALDAAVGRRQRPPRPEQGRIEALREADLVALYAELSGEFPLRPAFGEGFLTELFGAMESVDLGGAVVRRMVRGEDGEVAGAYVMVVAVHGAAQVLEVVAGEDRAGLVLDHLLHDAAEQGAVEAAGRVEGRLLAALRSRRCSFGPDVWTMIQTRDIELRDAVFSGRALLTRLEGEWWMRPQTALR
jgi:hypothetical protein